MASLVNHPLVRFFTSRAWTLKIFMNRFPCYWMTGASVVSISNDFKKFCIKLPLNWRTRNILGSLFGGSIYGAVDPVYAVMFLQLLGKEYIVWDSGAEIHYVQPGRETLYGEFKIDDHEINLVKTLAARQNSVLRTYPVKLTNKRGDTVALIAKTIYIRKKTRVAEEFKKSKRR